MAGEDLINYAGQASIAYQDALNQARNAQNALLRQYGFVAPTGTGEYSTEAAQAAFDPNMLFDKATGGIDKAKLDKALGGIMSGGGGLIGEALAAGAAGEAEAAMQERGRFAEGVTGGVSSQRRQLAESLAREQVSGVKGQFVSQIGEALAPIGGAFQNLQIAEAQTAYLDQLANAAKSTIPTQTVEEQPVTGKPQLSGGPQGDFMKKMNNISKSSDKKAQINNLKTIKDKFALNSQQLRYVDNFLNRLGG